MSLFALDYALLDLTQTGNFTFVGLFILQKCKCKWSRTAVITQVATELLSI